MSEEFRHGTELNEAELKNVSGGGDPAWERAEKLCIPCSDAMRHCSGDLRLLYAYLKENGVDSVKHFRECPYYKRAV